MTGREYDEAQSNGDSEDRDPVPLSVDELNEIRDRPLTESYEVHDIGYEILVARLHARGLTVQDHGDDNRHVEAAIYGEGPDLEIRSGGETVAYIEIKCKTDPEWFGRCNRRHYEEYVAFAGEVDVPVFVWFAYVDTEKEIVRREAFIRVDATDQIDGEVIDVTESEVVFYEADSYEIEEGLLAVAGEDVVGVRHDDVITDWIPDVWGNEVIELDESAFRSFPHFLHTIDY